MIKRLLASIIILFIIAVPCFSMQLYLTPYGGSVNVNLNTPSWQEVESPRANPFGGDNRIVALIALTQLTEDQAKEYGLRITISSPSERNGYFWFTSQSNPDSQRPFFLQVAGQYRGNSRYGLTDKNKGALWGIFPSNSSYVDVKASNGDIDDVDGITITNFALIPDIGFILPGEISNGVLKIPSEESASGFEEVYSIVPAEDYSCDVTIRVEIIDRNGSPVSPGSISGYAGPCELELTIPFSGYYDPLQGEGTTTDFAFSELSSALSVRSLPKTATFDLINDQGETFPIAEIDYSVYNLRNYNDSEAYDDSIFVFLSASPDPYVGNQDGFRFVHEDVASGFAPNVDEYIPYTLSVIPDAHTAEEIGSSPIDFSGKEYIAQDGTYSQDFNKLVTRHNVESTPEAKQEETHWHSFGGTIELNLGHELTTMKSGYYKSYVYVHAIVDETAAALNT